MGIKLKTNNSIKFLAEIADERFENTRAGKTNTCEHFFSSWDLSQLEFCRIVSSSMKIAPNVATIHQHFDKLAHFSFRLNLLQVQAVSDVLSLKQLVMKSSIITQIRRQLRNSSNVSLDD